MSDGRRSNPMPELIDIRGVKNLRLAPHELTEAGYVFHTPYSPVVLVNAFDTVECVSFHVAYWNWLYYEANTAMLKDDFEKNLSIMTSAMAQIERWSAVFKLMMEEEN